MAASATLPPLVSGRAGANRTVAAGMALVAAAALMLAGGVIALRTLSGRRPAAEFQPSAAVHAGPRQVTDAIPVVTASAAPRHLAAQARPCAEPAAAAA